MDGAAASRPRVCLTRLALENFRNYAAVSLKLDGRLTVDAAHVAGRLVKAHQAVHFGDGAERSLDGRFDLRGRRAFDAYLDEGAEQRPGAAKAIGRGIHRRPGSVSRLR